MKRVRRITAGGIRRFGPAGAPECKGASGGGARETKKVLLERIEALQARLDEAEETLRALRSGEVDAIVASGPEGDRVYTLKGADEPYRVMVEGMAEGAATLTPDGLILFSNQQFAAILRRPLERVIGSRIQNLIALEDVRVFSALLRGSGRRKAELRLQGDCAGGIPVYASLDDLSLGDGRGLCLIVTDLTEQKRNEGIVAEERLTRSVLEQAGEAIVVVDPRGRILRSNRAADVLAWAPLPGRSFDEVFRISLPKSACYTFPDILQELQRGETVQGIEATAVTHDGRSLDLRLSASAISAPGSGVLACVVTLTDVTALKRAEREREIAQGVEAERRRLNEILEGMPVMVCLLTPDHQVHFANRRFREFFGESGGRRCFEYVAGLEAPCPQCQAFRPLETNEPVNWEWVGPGGCTVDVHNLPFKEVDGSPMILEVNIDVTERKRAEAELARHREDLQALVKERTRELEEANAHLQAEIADRKEAEEALRRNREWLRVTLTRIGDGVMACDPAGRVTFMNPVAEGLTGWSAQEALGRPIQKIFNIIDELTPRPPDDIVERVLKERHPIALADARMLRAKDGREIPIEDSGATILDEAGHLAGAVLVFHDVSARRQAQAALAAAHAEAVNEKNRLLALMEALPVGVALMDASGAIVTSNAAFDQVWRGSAPAGMDAGNRGFRAWWAASGQPVQPEEWAGSRALRHGVPVIGQELRIQRFDGGTGFLLNSAAPVRDAEGRIAGSAVVLVDITYRKRAEQAIRESQSRLEAVFAALPGVVLEYDANGLPVRANQAALRTAGFQSLGFTREQGVSLLKVRHPEGQPATMDELPAWRALRGETVSGDLYCITTVDGDERFVSASAAPIVQEGTVTGAVALWHDVTELKRAEQALRESRAKLEVALASMMDAVFISDAQGRLVDFNDAFATYHRFTSKEDCWRNLAEYPEILEVLLADGTPAPLDMWAVPLALRGETAASAEYILRRKDTGETWAGSYSFGPIRDKDGRIAGSVVVARDITERKRAEQALRASEERFRAIYEHGPVGIALGDLEGRLELVNPAFEAILGYERGELIGVNYRAFTLEENFGLEAAYVEEMIAGKRDHYDMEKRYVRKDGQVIWVSLSTAVIRSERGEPLHSVAMVHDITVRKVLEDLVRQHTAELEKARDQAQAANQAKTAFLAHMTHELRTPLNSILGFSNLLLENCTSDDQRKDLEIIGRSGEHLLGLVNDVLDLAKIEAGQSILEAAPCELRSLVRDVAAMMRVRATEKLLIFEVCESLDVPRIVRTDAPKLRQIVINLLGNAIKFTEKGSVALRLKAGPAGENGRVPLTIEVEDTGIGIAPEDQARIFDAFVQAGAAGRHRGTGLGLAITRHFVELMGGTIAVHSELGKGSSFRVELPVERAQEFAEASVDAEHILGLEPGQRDYRVLIVEDQQENWMLLRRLLESVGFQVQVAEDGAKGVEIFRAWRPHFIWMDLRMPVMDGLAATRQIRELEGGREVKIAAATAAASSAERDEVRAAGLDDYVRKPYRAGEIYECMARHLGIRYRCAGRAARSDDEPAAQLTLAGLSALPDGLLRELRDAVTSLNENRIALSIDRVAERDHGLGLVLRDRAGGFAYTAILHAIDACRKQPA